MVSNQNYTTLEDTPLIVVAANGLLRAAIDPDGFPIGVINTTTPANGKLTVARSGSLTYVPNANYNGADNFDFWGGDGRGAPGKGTVSLWIGGPAVGCAIASVHAPIVTWSAHQLGPWVHKCPAPGALGRACFLHNPGSTACVRCRQCFGALIAG